MTIRMLVGLGNPGAEYEGTRHNAGFWWVDAVAPKLGARLAFDRSYQGLVARVNRPGQESTTWAARMSACLLMARSSPCL